MKFQEFSRVFGVSWSILQVVNCILGVFIASRHPVYALMTLAYSVQGSIKINLAYISRANVEKIRFFSATHYLVSIYSMKMLENTRRNNRPKLPESHRGSQGTICCFANNKGRKAHKCATNICNRTSFRQQHFLIGVQTS